MANINNGDIIHSSAILSDRSVSGKVSKASTVARTKGYSDLDLKLTLHKIRKDIIPLRDDQAVKNSIRNLILTNFHERPFQAQTGANLRGLLFEPADAITELALEDNIRRVLKDEPRVRPVFVEVTDLADLNAYRITVKFLIKQLDSTAEVEIVLRRLR
jgi:phage baseplate assembly protein W|tara:strand:+ start:2240 stop:2716 length:477 start_codon:yes stop_codon:yes gene_type:complete